MSSEGDCAVAGNFAMPDSPDSPGVCCRPLFAPLLIPAVRRGHGCAPIFSDCTEIQASGSVRPNGRKETAKHVKREAQTTCATERFEVLVQTAWACGDADGSVGEAADAAGSCVLTDCVCTGQANTPKY